MVGAREALIASLVWTHWDENLDPHGVWRQGVSFLPALITLAFSQSATVPLAKSFPFVGVAAVPHMW